MPILSPSEGRFLLKSKQRLMGLDVGKKTIGVSVSDPGHIVATPLNLIKRTKLQQDIEKLEKIFQSYFIQGLVVGYPINMDGTEGPRCQSTRQFSQNLLKFHDLPLILWDERWSTQAVRRTLIEADLSRRRQAEVVDKLAATYILQGFLDYLSNSERLSP